jgi:hypothetical protein
VLYIGVSEGGHMNDLTIIFGLIKGGEITGDQTVDIDVALANAQVSDVPDNQTQSVIDYIDVHLVYNTVRLDIKTKLEQLYVELQNRK